MLRHHRLSCCFLTLRLGLVLACCAGPARPAAAGALPGQPVTFEQNRGQVDSRFDFVHRSAGAAILISRQKLRMLSRESHPWSIRLYNSTHGGHGEGLDRTGSLSNYFSGSDPARWIAGLPSYSRVRYGDVYPNVDVEYYSRDAFVEFDFILRPGADPSRILLDFQSGSASLEPNGDLVVRRGQEILRLKAPKLYQGKGVFKTDVTGGFRLDEAGRAGFYVGEYDRSLTLVIDPVIAFPFHPIGVPTGIAVDAAGNIAVSGYAQRPEHQSGSGWPSDAYAARLRPDGTPIFTTYLGGANDSDWAYGVATDAGGNVYLTGLTESANFPVTAGSVSPAVKGFVVKLSPAGGLIYSHGIEGAAGKAIAVTARGEAAITGSTLAVGKLQVPPTALQPTYGGGDTDAFIMQLNPAGSQAAYVSFAGGPANEVGTGIAFDASGAVYITGNAFRGVFPPANALGLTKTSASSFVLKFHQDGTRAVYGLRLPAMGTNFLPDRVFVAVDKAGSAYVCGSISSTNLPAAKGAFQLSRRGAGDLGVLKVAPDGKRLLYATYFGSSNVDSARGLAVDAQGNVVLAGISTVARGAAPALDLPITPGWRQAPILPPPGLYREFVSPFVAKLDASGSALLYSSGPAGLPGISYIDGFTQDLNGALLLAVSMNGPVGMEAVSVTDESNHNAVVKIQVPSGRPALLRKVAGDRQAGLLHGTSRLPLVVEVLDAGGRPVSGVSVAYRGLRSSSAEIWAATDETGSAAARVVFDDGPGEVAFEASVEGLESVQFTATVNGPPVLRSPAGSRLGATSAYRITTVAGSPGRPFLSLLSPGSLVFEDQGAIVVADQNRVLRLKPDQSLDIVAADLGVGNLALGPGGALFATEGNNVVTISPSGLVTRLGTVPSSPSGLCVDPNGNAYTSSLFDHRIFRVDPAGRVSVFAGHPNGERGFAGDGGPASAALMARTLGLACTAGGSVYVADSRNLRIRRIGPDGGISTVAGGGATSSDSVRQIARATDLKLGYTVHVAVAHDGTLYFSEIPADVITGELFLDKVRIWKVAPDGGAAVVSWEPAIRNVGGLAVDPGGVLHATDLDRSTVMKAGNNQVLRPYAGPAPSPSGIPARAALLSNPEAIAVDRDGNLYIADTATRRIRRVDPSGTLHTIAGNPDQGAIPAPAALAVDPAGRILVGTANGIFRLDEKGALLPFLSFLSPAFTWNVTAIAYDERGSIHWISAPAGYPYISRFSDSWQGITKPGEPGYAGDGGPALYAKIVAGSGLAVDREGNIYFSDAPHARVRRIDARGIVTTVAGTGIPGFSGDGGPAVRAQLNHPIGVAVDKEGNLFIADAANFRIRMVGRDGLITTVAGSGTHGFSGDGGPATAAQLWNPRGLYVHGSGDIYVSEWPNQVVRKLTLNAAGSSTGLFNAASFQFGPIAPDEIVVLTGDGLDAAGTPDIRVTDAEGMERTAVIKSQSAEQLSFVVPAGSAYGPAGFSITGFGPQAIRFQCDIQPVAPGIFSADGTGRGAPAAIVQRTSASGEQSSEEAYDCSDDSRSCRPKRIDMNDGEALELVLAATGIRHRSDLAGVKAAIGGIAAGVSYAGAGDEDGFDRLTLSIPGEAAGRGLVDVFVEVDGKAANPLFINMGGDDGGPPLLSWDFNRGADGWRPVNISASRVWEGVWTVDPANADPYLVGPRISVPASVYNHVQVRMASRCRGGSSIYFRTSENDSYGPTRRVLFPPNACVDCDEAAFVIHSIRMDTNDEWKSAREITEIRLDPCQGGNPNTDSDRVDVDYIRLSAQP